MKGWLCHHSRPAWVRSGKMVTPLAGAAGLPDLILVKAPRVIFAELKREQGGVISLTQNAWLVELAKCAGVETYVWRPSDRDEVFRLLS